MLKSTMFAALIFGGILSLSANAGEVIKETKKVSDVDRLQSRKIIGIFSMSGYGKDQDWGTSKEIDFNHKIYTVIRSRILEKKVLPSGYIRVVEERTFDQYNEVLQIDPKVKIDFSSLPINEFKDIVMIIGKLISIAQQNPTSLLGAKVAIDLLNELDGKELHIPPAIRDKIMEQYKNKFSRMFANHRPVAGQTYRIIYYQSKKGKPLKITFANINGKPLNEQEETILKRVDAFINYTVLPETDKRIGGTWNVNAEDMGEFFDPFLGASIAGNVKFTRLSNEGKYWKIKMNPAILRILNDNYSRIGKIELREGTAIVEPRKFHNVESLQAKGLVETEKLNKHHMLFTAKISSACNFEVRVVSEIIE